MVVAEQRRRRGSDLAVVLAEMRGGFKAVGDRLDRVEHRMNGFEERMTAGFDRVDARLDQVDVRLDRVDERLGHVEERLGAMPFTYDGASARW